MKYEINDQQLRIYLSEAVRGDTAGSFLKMYCQSRRRIYLLLSGNKLLLDDRPLNKAEDLLEGSVLTLKLERSEPDWPCGKKECRVIYEDDFVYIVHKEPGLIIHNAEDPLDCLNAQASLYQWNHGIQAPVRPIHRLDKETQGLVLYSKIPFFQPWLDNQLSSKKIRRIYLAIVKGRLKSGTKFTVNQPIARDRHVSNKYRVSPNGKEAVTHFEVLASKGGYSLVRCVLETGRTHQIRVHLSWYGHPIVNDAVYGRPASEFKNMGLWAYELQFNQPVTLKRYKVMDAVDSDFRYFGEEINDEI